jgi:glutathione-regulated potassium-efflux system ancillary protein KefG
MAEAATTLVIFAHPVLERARVAPGLLAAAQGAPNVEVRDLYELYPDFTIDVEAEQAALERHRRIVLQFPFFWYAAPALMKEWLDLILTHGWAYGETGLALKGKSMACAISTGGGRTAYQTKGHNRFTIDEFLRPFEQTAYLCNMRWERPFVVHGAAVLAEADLKREAARYADYLRLTP